MPKFRQLSGDDVIAILASFGFAVVHQRGSHVKLRRILPDGTRQTLHIPNHRRLDLGTCRAIFRQAAQYAPESDLAAIFLTD